MSESGPYRLSRGGLIDRSRVIKFTFNNQTLSGLAGDTLASALLANGVRTIGRAFKFHRPRGVYSCGVEEPNAFVQLESGARTVPSARSTLIELYEGLEACVPSGWPSLNFDLARVLDFTAPLWAAGFYNKTFIWPSWHAYEWLVRRMAGFGHAPEGPDPDRYDVRNLHCDVLVLGGGAAGVQAANTAAADANARVVLVEQRPRLEGPCHEQVQVLLGTTAVGCYDHEVVTLLERLPVDAVQLGKPRERYWIVRTKRVVLATGAIEQPLIFCNNDRPGIMLAGAAREYLQRYAVAVGRRVAIATNNDTAYPLAKELWQAGIKVVALIDTRTAVPPRLEEEVHFLSIPLFTGSIPIDSHGFGALCGISIGRLSRDGQSVQSTHRIACDALAVSGGWNPILHLYSQASGKLIYDDSSGSLVPLTSGALWPANRHPSIEVVGSAADRTPIGPRVSPVGNTRRQWLDLRHDVTVSDLELALRESYTSIEHVKRYTTVGMAADQGKTSNVATLEIVARLRGVKPSELGHTTQRPPFVPVSLGAIAGRSIGDRFVPSRRTPTHDWHVAHGGVMEDYGEWKRAAVYLRTGESRHERIRREARAVRSSAGIFDASPLGKIEVTGPDALEFLDRFYINNLRTLKPGRVRYGIMLRESGTIFDDGTVVMLAPDRLLVTTTSANAGRVATVFEEWLQCEWSQLRVAVTPVTEQWAVASLTGPHARDILSMLETDIDFSNEAFPHLTLREGRLLGFPARIYRVSFSGELTYEINVPASKGQTLWDTLLAAGKPYELAPFGIEALLLMRLEKGFLHIGTDTDGTTVPDDVGFGKIAAGKSADFIGKRSLRLPEHVRPNRLQLVGLTSESDIVVGSHLRLIGSTEPTDGWVTSAGRATLTGEPIAMALLRAGRRQEGAHVTLHDQGGVTRATVVRMPFFDPAGDRMNA